MIDFKHKLEISQRKRSTRFFFYYFIYHALCYAKRKETKTYKDDDELRKELPDGFFEKLSVIRKKLVLDFKIRN